MDALLKYIEGIYNNDAAIARRVSNTYDKVMNIYTVWCNTGTLTTHRKLCQTKCGSNCDIPYIDIAKKFFPEIEVPTKAIRSRKTEAAIEAKKLIIRRREDAQTVARTTT